AGREAKLHPPTGRHLDQAPDRLLGVVGELVGEHRDGPRRLHGTTHTNVSRLPAGPGSPEEATPLTDQPRSRANSTTEATAARLSSAERTTPPLPTRSGPTSNCGLTSARQSNSGAAVARTAGSTFASEMNDTSTAIRSGRYGSASGSSARA